MHSQAVVLGEVPKSYRPIVQDNDNYDSAHELGIIFEPERQACTRLCGECSEVKAQSPSAFDWQPGNARLACSVGSPPRMPPPHALCHPPGDRSEEHTSELQS